MWRSREHVLSETRVYALEGITTRQTKIVAGVFALLLFIVADTISDIPLFPSVSADLSDLTGDGRSWQMAAIEVTCKVHYGARQVYTACSF